MAKCKYCGEKVGLFQDKHDECEQKFIEGQKRFCQVIREHLFLNPEWRDLEGQLQEIVDNSYIGETKDDLRNMFITAWDDAVDHELKNSDEPITKEYESSILNFKATFGFSKDDLNRHGNWDKLVESRTIGILLSGELPNTCSFEKSDLPVMFQNDEELIWVFPNDTEYYKIESKTHREGGYSGWSGRITKGLYYKWGSFDSRSVRTLEKTHLDTGHLIITNQNIYFHGGNKGFKLPLKRILSLEPFSEGVKIQKTQANAYPIFFVTGDGGFLYNLLLNLYQLQNG